MAGSDNRLKIPVARSLNQLSSQRAANAQIDVAKGIPATIVSRNGQIVTVSFAMQVGGPGGPWTQATADYPIGTASTDWLPLSAGTAGLLLPSDFYLGGVTGQGGGTADYAQRGNLSTLSFFPLSHTSWTPPGSDTDKRCLQGPNGVYMQSSDGACSLSLDKTSGLTATFSGHTLQIKSDGIYLDGIRWDTHEHTGVTAGGDNTGGPVAG